MAKSKEELKSLLMKVKKESEKAGLKLNIQKMKIMASSPIISWQTDGETMETVRVFIFLGSKITVDGDLSHEIKRWLLVGRKTMTNLDSILKSRDITLRINVHLVKAMVFPVVMYGSESLTIKKAEHRRIDAFELWCWRRLLRVPWTTRRSNWLILKEIGPEYLLEGPMLKLNLQYSGYLMWKALANTLYKVFFQYFGHLMWRLISKDPDSGKERRQEAKGKTEDEMVRWHHWLNGHEFEQVLEVWRTRMPGVLQSTGSQRVGHTWVNNNKRSKTAPKTAPMQQTWTWANFGRWWRTGTPGVLQSMESQGAGRDWVTEQQIPDNTSYYWISLWEQRLLLFIFWFSVIGMKSSFQ